MRYTFQTTLSPSQELELFFGLISSDRYGKTRFCRLPSEIVQKEASNILNFKPFIFKNHCEN